METNALTLFHGLPGLEMLEANLGAVNIVVRPGAVPGRHPRGSGFSVWHPACWAGVGRMQKACPECGMPCPCVGHAVPGGLFPAFGRMGASSLDEIIVKKSHFHEQLLHSLPFGLYKNIIQ